MKPKSVSEEEDTSATCISFQPVALFQRCKIIGKDVDAMIMDQFAIKVTFFDGPHSF